MATPRPCPRTRPRISAAAGSSSQMYAILPAARRPVPQGRLERVVTLQPRKRERVAEPQPQHPQAQRPGGRCPSTTLPAPRLASSSSSSPPSPRVARRRAAEYSNTGRTQKRYEGRSAHLVARGHSRPPVLLRRWGSSRSRGAGRAPGNRRAPAAGRRCPGCLRSTGRCLPRRGKHQRRPDRSARARAGGSGQLEIDYWVKLVGHFNQRQSRIRRPSSPSRPIWGPAIMAVAGTLGDVVRLGGWAASTPTWPSGPSSRTSGRWSSATATTWKQFFAAFIETLKRLGKQFALPHVAHPGFSGQYVNLDALAQAGIPSPTMRRGR